MQDRENLVFMFTERGVSKRAVEQISAWLYTSNRQLTELVEQENCKVA